MRATLTILVDDKTTHKHKSLQGRNRISCGFWNQSSLLQKAHCVGGFLRREAKAEGAGGHFWHDAVTKPNIITPAP